MRMPGRGEKGFTLIELLIVIAILGVLAAVVIPNVGKFLGRGETEALKTEFHNIASAVLAMMVDNNITAIPTPYTDNAAATNDMTKFPDNQTTWTAKGGTGSGKDGYLMFEHQKAGTTNTTNYVNIKTTKGYYTVEADGTIHQWNKSGSGATEYRY